MLRGWSRVSLLAAAVAILVSGVAAGLRRPAHPLPSVKVALAAIDRQAARGRLTPAEASRYRAIVSRHGAPRAPAAVGPGGAAPLAAAAGRGDRARAHRAARARRLLAARGERRLVRPPRRTLSQTDITDADGIVYRYFPGHGFEFHPLGNFAALNAVAGAKDTVATTRLANALLARAVPDPNGTVLGVLLRTTAAAARPGSPASRRRSRRRRSRAPRRSTRPTRAALRRRRARRLPLAPRAAGRADAVRPLDPAVRLQPRGRPERPAPVGDLARGVREGTPATPRRPRSPTALKAAAARALPSFSTGYWSYYALPADVSDVHYQDYVTELLGILARRDDRFTAAAAEFASFRDQPPRFRLASAGVGQVTFWVSKPATVSVSAIGGARRFAARRRLAHASRGRSRRGRASSR